MEYGKIALMVVVVIQLLVVVLAITYYVRG